MTVLRDWNIGKIPFYTTPPANHASVPIATQVPNGDSEMIDQGQPSGGAKILNQLSEAFTLDGLFDATGDDAAWEDKGNGKDQAYEMEEE